MSKSFLLPETSVLSAINLSKTYQEQKIFTPVLRNFNLSVYPEDQIAITGVSGSGKSTLLHLLGGLDSPTSGEVKLLDQPFSKLNANQRALLRNKNLGFIYQFHHLLPELTALENIALPLFLSPEKITRKEKIQKAKELLNQVRLAHRAHHRPSELSGGERQRVAIARALINQPVCLLADEPTGNLDEFTANGVFSELIHMVRTQNMAALIATHNLDLAKKMDRIITIKERKVIPWTSS